MHLETPELPLSVLRLRSSAPPALITPIVCPSLMQVLCKIDAADGLPSFDMDEVAGQSEAQMATILHSVSAHLNELDRSFHAENHDAAFHDILKVMHCCPAGI